ncbi:MAG TPA: hypothetical protein VKI64_06760 [Acidimicrobiales bacterium]|nr:hypothetical protein [Acidimicrobiales bacterium]
MPTASRPGSVRGLLLAHDGGANRGLTLQALPLLIDDLSARGYLFVTVSELLAAGRPAPP